MRELECRVIVVWVVSFCTLQIRVYQLLAAQPSVQPNCESTQCRPFVTALRILSDGEWNSLG